MTYDDLIADIQNFMEDDGLEFTSAIPRFIELAELRLSRQLAIPAFRQRKTSAVSANDAFLTMPNDVVALENLHLVDADNQRHLLLLRSDEFMTEFWPDRTATGRPRYYAYFTDTVFYLAPTPASNINVEISYRRRLPGLSADNQTNWLTENAFDALLFGALAKAGQFNRNYALEERYEAAFAAAIAEIDAEQQQRNSIDNFYQKAEG